MTTHDPELVERVAQAAWQAYVMEVGRSLPPGLANKLARAVLDAITETHAVIEHRWLVALQDAARSSMLASSPDAARYWAGRVDALRDVLARAADSNRCECAEILYDGGGFCPKHDARPVDDH